MYVCMYVGIYCMNICHVCRLCVQSVSEKSPYCVRRVSAACPQRVRGASAACPRCARVRVRPRPSRHTRRWFVCVLTAAACPRKRFRWIIHAGNRAPAAPHALVSALIDPLARSAMWCVFYAWRGRGASGCGDAVSCIWWVGSGEFACVE